MFHDSPKIEFCDPPKARAQSLRTAAQDNDHDIVKPALTSKVSPP